MNYKLFYTCLMTFFGMMFWLLFQQGSMDFIAVRIIIAFISVILLFFSVTWNEKGGWKKAVVVLLVIIGFGSIANFAFGWGISHYPGNTLLTMAAILVLGLLYIKFVEPKILNKKPKQKLPPQIYN